jgi:hypothetical protein
LSLSSLSSIEASSDMMFHVIPNCATYLHVQIVPHQTLPAGDHVAVLCQVIGTYHWDPSTQNIIPTSSTNTQPISSYYYDATTVLYTGQLRQEGNI